MSRPLLTFAGIAALMGLAIAGTYAEQTHRETQIVTIDSKERQCDTSTSTDSQGRQSVDVHCYYVVFGTNGEVFRNEDVILLFGGGRPKFDSATMQARLHVGGTYRITTIGWRSPVLSMKPNIIDAVEVG